MSRTIRIVNYAVNGSGVGHLMRLVAANRWIRRYAAHAGVKAEIYFLTSSEADGLLFSERFASFKLPSKTIVEDTRIDKLTYLALAKQWVWHSLALLRPDLLVVDTFPRGSFGELLGALDLCRRRAFVYRPAKDSFAARGEFQAMLPLYDLIAVPDGRETPLPLPAGVEHKVRYTGPVLARERVELVPRAEARARLGIAGDRLAVWVSAGGGGDPGAERQLHAVCDALRADPDLHLVVAAGPLYRGRMVVGERVTWLERAASELLLGVDAAVCAAGYNTFGELMHAGVPAVFLPQEKIADDQEARAQRAVAAGAAQVVPAGEVAAALARWRDPAARAAAARAARALVPENCARQLAAELLRLVLPAAAVDAAEEAIGDEVLAAATELSVGLETIVDVLHDLRGDAETADASEAVALVRHMVTRGVPLAAGARLIALLARKLLAATPRERAAAARRLLADLEAFADWNGAAALLKVFAVEKQLGADAFAGALSRFLGGLRDRGEDLYRGIARLSAAAGDGAPPSNQELLAQAVRA